MQILTGRMVVWAAVFTSLLLVPGCGESTREGKPLTDQQDTITTPVYPALKDTVGEYAVLGTSQPIRVEGYGIVADLPDTGSSDMPTEVRDVLADLLYKAGADRTTGISPDRILATNKIALVEVHGYIPPMTIRGGRFDLSITAYPGTQTTSLEHGLLWTTELRVIGLAGSAFETRTLARGRGQVYCVPDVPEANVRLKSGRVAPASTNPATNAARRNLRRGRVLSGGVVMEDMPATLQLLSPSERLARLTERLINAHYPATPHYASAKNDSLIELRIPNEYKENPQAFVDIIMHMYMRMDVAGFIDQKAPELINALRDPKAPHDEIALALLGLGRQIIDPYLRARYTDSDIRVRFYTAYVGAALEDIQGEIVLEEFARDSKNPYRKPAIAAIGRLGRASPSERSTTLLVNLLNDPDTQIRLAAYHGLRFMRSPVIRGFGEREGLKRFDIDIVPSTGPNLVYATQSGRERIALIGPPLNLPPGLLFVSPDSLLSISVPETLPVAPPVTDPAKPASAADKLPVLLYYRSPLGDKTATLNASTNLAVILAKLGYEPNPLSRDYNPKEPFIALSYQEAVEALSALCKDNDVNATFILQPEPMIEPSATDLTEDARPEGFIITHPTTAPATKQPK